MWILYEGEGLISRFRGLLQSTKIVNGLYSNLNPWKLLKIKPVTLSPRKFQPSNITNHTVWMEDLEYSIFFGEWLTCWWVTWSLYINHADSLTLILIPRWPYKKKIASSLNALYISWKIKYTRANKLSLANCVRDSLNNYLASADEEITLEHVVSRNVRWMCGLVKRLFMVYN